MSVIIPAKFDKDPQLQELLRDLQQQEFPQEQLEVLVETRGNSEQAKAYAIQRARGEILGFFCTDNRIRDRQFLSKMLWWTHYLGVDGAYSTHYDYVIKDRPLSRYFALMGGNDPLCWWLGKNDRAPLGSKVSEYLMLGAKTKPIPSIGDNGFFVRRSVMGNVNPNQHFCIDAIQDIRDRSNSFDHPHFVRVGTTAVWHKSGESLGEYLRRRYRYTKELYWRDYEKRRWLMVGSRRDWFLVCMFALSSVLVVPHLLIALRGYRRIPDWAWFLHPFVCLLLTGVYGWLLMRYGIASLLKQHRRNFRNDSGIEHR